MTPIVDELRYAFRRQLLNLAEDDTGRIDSTRRHLLEAVVEGRADIVEWILTRHANFQEVDPVKLVQAAVIFNRQQVLEMLLAEMPSLVEAKNRNNDTPLNMAAVCGFDEIVKYLVVKMGANIENRGFKDRTPLMQAAQNGHVEVVKFLLANCANIMAVSNGNDLESMAIHLAAENGRRKAVKLLLKQMPSLIEAKNLHNDTALNRAAIGGCLEVVKLLVLEKGANVENQGFSGRTPLLQAVVAGNFDVVEFLLKNGANIDAVGSTYFGYGAIHLAAYLGYGDIVDLMLSRKPSLVNAISGTQETPFSLAKQRNETEVMALLISKGAKDDYWL